eukprot:5320827-Amphidinium_carterae.2
MKNNNNKLFCTGNKFTNYAQDDTCNACGSQRQAASSAKAALGKYTGLSPSHDMHWPSQPLSAYDTLP